uniref:Uncharacterized protein n=1 Tax=Romanomermis culicivorax TaxID=13658 RepID=A0A915KLT4_ROMCU
MNACTHPNMQIPGKKEYSRILQIYAKLDIDDLHESKRMTARDDKGGMENGKMNTMHTQISQTYVKFYWTIHGDSLSICNSDNASLRKGCNQGTGRGEMGLIQ